MLVLYIQFPEINAYIRDSAHLSIGKAIVDSEMNVPMVSIELVERKWQEHSFQMYLTTGRE
jgi:hypothetical protein